MEDEERAELCMRALAAAVHLHQLFKKSSRAARGSYFLNMLYGNKKKSAGKTPVFSFLPLATLF